MSSISLTAVLCFSKLRVCKKCFEARENLTRSKIQQLELLSSSMPTTSGVSGQVINLDEEVKPSSSNSNPNEPKLTDYLHDIDDEEDDDPDINFEVRPEKLHNKPEEGEEQAKAADPEEEELARSASKTNLLKAASIYSNSKTSVSDSLAKLAASSSPNSSNSININTTSPNQKGIQRGAT